VTQDLPFDVAIIGGGPGGYVAAIRAAQLGARVALVEKDRLGGACLHRGCIPTKALLRSAEVLLESRDASTLGVVVKDAAVDFGAMMAWKERAVAQQAEELEKLIAWRKIAVFRGEGRLVGPDSIKVGAPCPAVSPSPGRTWRASSPATRSWSLRQCPRA
jgi:dihydrolipoamide dehydrogenase